MFPTQEINYDTIVDRLIERAGGQKIGQKAVASTPTYTSYAHGPGGLFSYPGMSRPFFSAMVLPRAGLLSRLPVFSTNDINPLFGLVTGVTAESGSEPNGPCDAGPTPGLLKICTTTFTFGRIKRDTPVFELDRFGQRTNRGEMFDLQLQGNPAFVGNGGQMNVPTVPNASLSNALASDMAKAMFEFAVAWARGTAADIYTSNPANNTPLGGRKYYRGLDILINTGYQDVITGQACAAADSLLYDFNGLNISDSTNGQTFVRRLVDLIRQMQELASDVGLAPVKWVLAMRRRLFWELTEVWPCAYNTYRCVPYWSAGTPLLNTPGELNAMRDAMRQGSYLLVDGEAVEVVIDQAITETVLAGATFESDIYMVPLTVLGSTPATYMEHIDYDGPNGPMAAAELLAPAGSYTTTDGGRFMWHKKPPTEFCVQMTAKTEPRLVLRTPHLAARFTNIRYTPLSHERGWDAANDTSYFVNGGRTDYVGSPPSFYVPISGQS